MPTEYKFADSQYALMPSDWWPPFSINASGQLVDCFGTVCVPKLPHVNILCNLMNKYATDTNLYTTKVNLRGVTFSGIDDSAGLVDLAEIGSEFPFVEWSLAVSNKKQGTLGYPSDAWILKLANDYKRVIGNLMFDLQEDVAYDFLHGHNPVSKVWYGIREHRVKIDFSIDMRHIVIGQVMDSMEINHSNKMRELVFSDSVLYTALKNNLHFVRQLLREDTKYIWPVNAGINPVGYTGNLSYNLANELPRIAKASGPAPFWLDIPVQYVNKRINFDAIYMYLKFLKGFIKA